MPSLLVKTYELDGARYLFMVNSTPETMRVSVKDGKNWKPGSPYQTNLFSKSDEIEFTPWEVAIFKS